MPELPEVETTLRGMQARLQDRRLARIELRRPDLRWTIPAGFVAEAEGARVTGFRRRGKYILMRLDRGLSVLVHLGMSGRIVIEAPDQPVPENVRAHEHVVFHTETGWRLGLVDPRRFGAVDLMPTEKEDEHRLLAQLGPEPLGEAFTPALLAAALAGRRAPLKAVLLDQRIIAGLGNIYVCEALFRARLAPDRLAGTVREREVTALHGAIQAVLTEAIAAGGSSLRDYVQPDGELGYFQHAWKVYGRAGQPCEACPGAPGCDGIARVVQSGRSTFFCLRLQR